MSDTAISAAPLIAVLQPYITAVVMAIIGFAIPLAFAKLSQLIGVKINSDLVTQVKLEAQKEAGIAIAAATDNLSSKSITINDPTIRRAAASIAESIPSVIAKVGYSPDDVAKEVVAAIGKLQSASPTTAVAVVPTPVDPVAAGRVAIATPLKGEFQR